MWGTKFKIGIVILHASKTYKHQKEEKHNLFYFNFICNNVYTVSYTDSSL